MSNGPKPQSGIMNISPYVPGRSSTGLSKTLAKLSANESPLGTSPRAKEALRDLENLLTLYPEGSSAKLRETLAQVHGLEADKIIIGAGSDEILHLLAQSFLGEGDEAIVSEFGFLVYPIVTHGAGATPVYARDKDFVADVDAILDAVTPRTKMVFLANPNNPTGTMFGQDELFRLHAGLRDDILLVLDGAYAEYVTREDYDLGIDLVRAHENVVMVRTFSKIGLAALRLGWLYGPSDIVDIVNRLRGPFNVNVAAQIAGEASALDREFIENLRAHNAKWREWLTDQIQSNHIRVLPSQTNFVLAMFAPDAPVSAAQMNEALLAAGYVVREVHGYGFDNALRISIGEEDAMRAVAQIFQDMMAR